MCLQMSERRRLARHPGWGLPGQLRRWLAAGWGRPLPAGALVGPCPPDAPPGAPAPRAGSAAHACPHTPHASTHPPYAPHTETQPGKHYKTSHNIFTNISMSAFDYFQYNILFGSDIVIVILIIKVRKFYKTVVEACKDIQLLKEWYSGKFIKTFLFCYFSLLFNVNYFVI